MAGVRRRALYERRPRPHAMPSAHDRYAKDYDEQIRKADCHLADVLFGMSCEFVKTGDRLLDVGIGTGMSSALFRRAGLRVFGIDGSAKMLEVCRRKDIAERLVLQDIATLPWPYEGRTFAHVISCGVFHFIADLDGIFSEMARIQTGGVLAFTTMRAARLQPGKDVRRKRTEDGIDVYSHSAEYIRQLLRRYRFAQDKEMVVFTGGSRFSVVVARRAKA